MQPVQQLGVRDWPVRPTFTSGAVLPFVHQQTQGTEDVVSRERGRGIWGQAWKLQCWRAHTPHKSSVDGQF